jgi:acrylyl-CoA reductase (NADPH)
MDNFQALVLEREENGQTVSLKTVESKDLPDGDVLVRVAYSSLNYKDALAVTGQGRVVRSFPMVPGIDLAGIVEESSAPEFQAGDTVLVTGWGIGERYWGGYGQLARVKHDWCVPLPKGLSLKQSMAIGTAGFTAMLSVLALEKHGLVAGEESVVVTGASGGVGSIAVAILAKLGYNPVASTGRRQLEGYLKELGATQLVDRAELAKASDRPLESGRWVGAVDTVGGDTLASLLKQMAPRCSVAACGNAGGFELNTTVFPFILRGVNLLGIDSVMCPADLRQEAWHRLSQDLPLELLDRMTHTATLAEVPELSEQILKGKVWGRTVIDING